MTDSERREETIEKTKNKWKKRLFGWVENNYDKAFLAILILAFIARFWMFLKTKDQAIWWDAADYLATAKKWAGVNSNLIDMWYYRRGFFWALFGAILFKLGLGEITLRFFIVLFSTGIIFVSYLLIKKMFNSKLALLTSLALASSWIYIFFSGRPLTNIPATFFLLTATLFFWKGYVLKEGNKFIYLFGLFFALTCLTRMQYSMFAIPFLTMVFMKEKFKFLKNKKLWGAVGIFALIFVPQMVMHTTHFGNPVSDVLNYYFGVEGISETGEVGGVGDSSKLLVYFTNLPYILDGNSKGYSSLFVFSPIYILFLIGVIYFFGDLVLGFDKIFSNKKIQKRLFIFTWIVSCFLILGRIAPHLEQRYMMQTLPFLFLIAIFPLPKLANYIHRSFKIRKKATFLVIFLALLLLLTPNMKFGNDLVESKKPSFLEVKQAGEWIKANSEPDDIIITASTPQNTYYSERPTYNFYLAPRRGMEPQNATGFYEFIEREKPKYLVLSMYEQAANSRYTWAPNYPQEYPDRVTPVQAFYQGEQPVLIIYEFNYKAS